MRAYSKQPLATTVQNKIVSYTQFALAVNEKESSNNVLYARWSLNCDCTNGSLQAGMSAVPVLSADGMRYTLSDLIEKPVWTFRLIQTEDGVEKERFGYVTASGRLYTNVNVSEKTFAYSCDVGKNSKPVLVFDNAQGNVLMFVGEEGIYRYCRAGCEQFVERELLPAGCFVNGRLLCAEKPGTLVYYTPFNVQTSEENIHDSGEVRLPDATGEIGALAACGEYAYVFCDFGIYRVSVAASARNFTIEKIDYTGGRIYGGSVCSTALENGKMFFMTDRGVCYLQGDKVRFLGYPCGFKPSKTQPSCQGTCFCGKYVLRFLEDGINIRTVVIDGDTEKMYETFDFMALNNIMGDARGFYQNIFCSIRMNEATPLDCFGTFAAKTSFGVPGNKALKKIVLYGEGKLRMIVSQKETEKIFSVDLSSGKAEVPVRFKGETFGLAFDLKNGAVVREVRAELAILKAGK